VVHGGRMQLAAAASLTRKQTLLHAPGGYM